MSPLFSFNGILLKEARLDRTLESVYEKINITANDLEITEWKNSNLEIKISIKFDLYHSENKYDHLEYISFFEINDREVIEYLEKELDDSEGQIEIDELDKTVFQILASLLSTSFPYIRSSINSLTADLGQTIQLPIIDSRALLQGIHLELARQ